MRAGSLFYALAVSVLIALASSALLLLSYYTNMEIDHDCVMDEVGRNSYSGIELLLGLKMIPSGELSEHDLFGNERDSVQTQQRKWGAYEIAISRAHTGGESRELVALVGSALPENERTALFLADLDRPLKVCGATELKGDCFLPAAGIERAYIEGKSFAGSELVNGKTERSERTLPRYNEELVKDIQSLFGFIPAENDSMASPEDLHATDTLHYSFFNRTLYVYSADQITLSTSISGNICIISKKLITVSRNSSLDNVLLIAPAIDIEDDVIGNFQAFARDSLNTGKNVLLNYPSVLGLLADKNSPKQAVLSLGEKSTISGQLFACNTFPDLSHHVLINISKGALTYGSVYCSDLIDHKGTVIGNVICSKFRLQTNSAEYDNHLLDAVIDRTSLSEEFVPPLFMDTGNKEKTIAEWLE